MGPGKSGHPAVIQYAEACAKAGTCKKFHCPTCGQPQHPNLNGEACATFITLMKKARKQAAEQAAEPTVIVRFVATTHPGGGSQEENNQVIVARNMTATEVNDPDHLRKVAQLYIVPDLVTKLESSHYLVADILGPAGTITETLILFRPPRT